jgi:hypothetical protein
MGSLVECSATGPGPPGRLSDLSISHRGSALYGALVRARRALDSPKLRFPARAVVCMCIVIYAMQRVYESAVYLEDYDL